jgi:hypothetical protein
MAYVISMWMINPDQDAPDFWNVTHDVFPKTARVTTDVMLIQALLIAYFSQPASVRPDLKTKAWKVITSSGKRFDDGIYGDNTREVMRLFEERHAGAVQGWNRADGSAARRAVRSGDEVEKTELRVEHDHAVRHPGRDQERDGAKGSSARALSRDVRLGSSRWPDRERWASQE